MVCQFNLDVMKIIGNLVSDLFEFCCGESLSMEGLMEEMPDMSRKSLESVTAKMINPLIIVLIINFVERFRNFPKNPITVF
jgi:hypothetical protein